ncbi:hypothetical protein F5X97DRAFT_298479 [Nemania serpens]|nr:hypothetical protein F5X97DRAFT_298479 [Nemania serpens]
MNTEILVGLVLYSHCAASIMLRLISVPDRPLYGHRSSTTARRCTFAQPRSFIYLPFPFLPFPWLFFFFSF